MPRFLISFPDGAMDHIAPEELPSVDADTRVVVDAAKRAGVWVFGGGIGRQRATVVDPDGTVREEPEPAVGESLGGFVVFDTATRQDALDWAARFAASCRCPQEVREILHDPQSLPGTAVATSARVVHIAERAAWDAARDSGEYRPATLERDGFIHCSTPWQVARVAELNFAGRDDLVLLVIDPARVDAPVVHENLDGGAEPFPHVYGELPVAAVESVLPLEWDDDRAVVPDTFALRPVAR